MNDPWPEAALSRDEFLGGRLSVWQPLAGYRAGVDPVLLAASIPARPGQSVLELGCGAGVASLCLGRRVEGLTLSGLELQAQYADLARRNAAANGIALEVVAGDLVAMPSALKERRFDHVIANPPYFEAARRIRAQDAGREMALAGETPLADWVKAAAKRAAPKGYVSFILRAERLPEVLSAAQGRLGSLEVRPLIPRAGRAARLILLRGRKGGQAGFCLHDGWILHAGAAHEGDGENYTDETGCILREGAALPF